MASAADIELAFKVIPQMSSAHEDMGISKSMSEPSALYKFIDCRAISSPENHTEAPPIFKDIVNGLTTFKALPGTDGPAMRSLPTVLLYNNKGLDLFDRITYLPEYYLTNCEIEILKTRTQDIIAEIPSDSDVIELGCGSLRKTKLLLDALNQQRRGITYYAIDVMPAPLHESMESLASMLPNISLVALCGTYDEVLAHFKQSKRRKTVLWLGSSIGNFQSADAYKMLSGITETALTENDAIIIGMDNQKEHNVVMDAYHDSQGITSAFELNALAHVNIIISSYEAREQGFNLTEQEESDAGGMFDVSKFSYVGEYSSKFGRHDAYLEAQEDVVVRWPQAIAGEVKALCGNAGDIVFKTGERIYIESSYKYGAGAAETLARASGLMHMGEWTDSRNYYSLHLFRKPRFVIAPSFALDAVRMDKRSGPESQAQSRIHHHTSLRGPLNHPPAIPREDELMQLWSAWDTLTLHIIPRDMLLTKPIDLRHPFIFYLGHIPAFTDIHMGAAESAPLTQPTVYAEWFERGIDPNIEDTSLCHGHSEIPNEWPALDDILVYRDQVRSRVLHWVRANSEHPEFVDAEAARHVWMSLEHEAMHLETLLYMVLQMPPSSICAPIGVRFKQQQLQRPPEQWIRYRGGSQIAFGLANDDERLLKDKKLPPNHIFGWDNESPQHRVDLTPFTIRTQPITNGEYMDFICAVTAGETTIDISLEDLMPRSWIELDSASKEEDTPSSSNNYAQPLASDYGVRTVVGTPSINSTESSLWPVFVSLRQAEAYAEWRGKRLPSEAEWTYAARTYHLAHALGSGSADSKNNSLSAGRQMPIDDYLNRVLEQQGTSAEEQVSQRPFDSYIPSDSNVGFAHWHPVSVWSAEDNNEHKQNTLLPEATFVGNGWEWTSTQFYPYKGFIASPMYPGYSADFFDSPDEYNASSAHFVVKGGSYATHLRIAQRQTFRNWYQRGYPYVLTTFRLCEIDKAMYDN